MSNRFHNVIAPEYAQQFRCVGSECPDTCCSGWRVDVDKTTFKKIKALGDEAASRPIKKYFKVNPNGDSLRYAYIEMEANGNCPALNEERLCAIQSEVGEDYLSKTCQFYPRQFADVGETVEMHLYLSCPEAARLCLHSDAVLQYESMDLTTPKGKPLPSVGGFSTKPNKPLPPKAFMFWQLRELIYELSANPSVSIWELVLLIGFLCEKLQHYFASEKEPNVQQIELLVLQSKLVALDGSFHSNVKQILPEERVLGLRALYMQVMTNEHIQIAGFKNKDFLDLVAQAFDGYNLFMDNKGLSDNLVWSEVNADIEKTLRNYLRNEVGLQVFPRLQDADMLTQWRKIVIKLSLVSFYLNGLRMFHGDEFSFDHCILMVQKFSKAISHNAAFLPRIDSLMTKAGIDGVAGLGILAR